MVHPFVLRLIDIQLCAKRTLVLNAFGALVHDRALRTRERQFLPVRFEEVLANFRADVLEEKTEMRQHWIVATDGLLALGVIDQAD